jgi:hypothetical protein
MYMHCILWILTRNGIYLDLLEELIPSHVRHPVVSDYHVHIRLMLPNNT